MIGTYLIMKNLNYIDMKGEISVKLAKSFYSCNSDCIRFLRGVSKVTMYSTFDDVMGVENIVCSLMHFDDIIIAV